MTLDFSALRDRFASRHGHTQPDWHLRARRWGTMNLTHGDAPDFDARFWLDYARECHLDAVSWNSGGIWATYPSELPDHPTLRGLKGDPFGDLVDGSRELGLVVTARVDHHAIIDEVAAKRPEWLARDFEGRPRPHWAAPGLVITCALGPYNELHMSDVMREVAARYGVDGFNHNRWAPQGMCYCDWCRSHFREATGRELPRVEEGTSGDRALFSLGDPRDEDWQAYFAWREARLLALWDGWNTAVQEINPHAFILPGIGAEAGKMSLAKLRDRARTLYLDYQGRSGATPLWMCGKGVKEVRAALGDDAGKPAGITFTVGVENGWPRWKDSTQSGAELRVWLAEALANNARPKWAKFDGRVRDDRWMSEVAAIYSFAARHERFLCEARSAANLALLVSPSSARFHDVGDKPYHGASMGWHQALLEARIPFDCWHEEFVSELDPHRVRALILPDCACLSDRALEGLASYVAAGGSLIASTSTGTRDEFGHERAHRPLDELLGLERQGDDDRQINAYTLLHHHTGSPLLRGLEAARRPFGPTRRVRVRARQAQSFEPAVATWVPPYPDLPMEEVYPRVEDSGESLVWARQASSGGRTVFLAGNYDRLFWDFGSPDHGLLLANAARWALKDEVPLRLEGAGFFDATLFQGQGFLIAHIVNFTNPFAARGPLREILPSGPLDLSVRAHPDFAPTSCRLLRADQEIEVRREGEWLHAAIPSVAEHEAIAWE